MDNTKSRNALNQLLKELIEEIGHLKPTRELLDSYELKYNKIMDLLDKTEVYDNMNETIDNQDKLTKDDFNKIMEGYLQRLSYKPDYSFLDGRHDREIKYITLKYFNTYI